MCDAGAMTTTVTVGDVGGLPLLAQCCSPTGGMPRAWAWASAEAIAEPTRLRLLSLVAAHEGAEACVCDLIDPVGLSQPTVSHHLRVLVEAGLLHREQRGRWAYYRLVPDALPELGHLLYRSLGVSWANPRFG